jgi:hypothetical protein
VAQEHVVLRAMGRRSTAGWIEWRVLVCASNPTHLPLHVLSVPLRLTVVLTNP